MSEVMNVGVMNVGQSRKMFTRSAQLFACNSNCPDWNVNCFVFEQNSRIKKYAESHSYNELCSFFNHSQNILYLYTSERRYVL